MEAGVVCRKGDERVKTPSTIWCEGRMPGHQDAVLHIIQQPVCCPHLPYAYTWGAQEVLGGVPDGFKQYDIRSGSAHHAQPC